MSLGILSASLLAVLSLGFSRRSRAGRARLLAGLGIAAATAFAGPEFPWLLLLSTGGLILLSCQRSEGETTPALVLASMIGMATIAAARHYLALFLGLELMSLPLYLLLARARPACAASLEAAIKYFFSGSLAAGLFLFGAAAHYAVFGRMFPEAPSGAGGPAGQAAFLLMACAALFKVGAFPMHFWLPDAYEAASPELAAFMSTSVKAAGFLLLFKVLEAAGEFSCAFALLPYVAGATMTAANLLALRQRSIQRLLAYSSMAHAGTLIAMASAGLGNDSAYLGLHLYLWIYLLMNTGAWLVVRSAGLRDVEDLRGLGSRRPWLSAFWALMVLSLAGVPPTGGFFAKLLVFLAAIQAGKAWLAAALVLNSLLALGYYLRLIREAFLEPAAQEAPEAPIATRLAPAVAYFCAAGVIWAGLWAPLTVGLEAWLR